MSNLRDTILNAQDEQSELVEVPEWGVTVKVVGMTGTDRSRFMAACIDAKGNPTFDRIYPEVIIACTRDPETDAKVFEATDRDMLDSKSAKATERIAKVALQLSGIDESETDAKNA
jgi:hypothetical protein